MIKNFFKGVFGHNIIEELKKENETLKKEIEELKSDRYLVKKLPSGRKPKRQTMHITPTHIQKMERRRLEDKTR